MQFAVDLLVPLREGVTQAEAFAGTLARVRLAEELGFDGVWIPESHFSAFSICPDPLTLAAYLAGSTARLRIGTGVVVLTARNPLALAESAAMVDVLSGGRLDLGIGRGLPGWQLAALRIGEEESYARFEEAYQVVVAAWTRECHSLGSWLAAAEPVPVLPRPLQLPYPPVWMAASRSHRSLSFAARHAHGLLQAAAGNQLRDNLRTFRELLSALGRDPGQVPVCLTRSVHVASSDARAHTDARAPVAWLLAAHQPRRPSRAPASGEVDAELASGRYIIGDPVTCITEISRLRDELGINCLNCSFGFGGMPEATAEKSMLLFATQVMPQFAETSSI